MRANRWFVTAAVVAVAGVSAAVPAGAAGAAGAARPHLVAASVAARPSGDRTAAAHKTSDTARIKALAKQVGGTVKYAVEQPLPCATPHGPRQIACAGMRRVTVSRTTPGARPYVAYPQRLASGPGGGYSPGQIAAAYGVHPATGGAKQTIGIVDWYNDKTIRHDLNTYDAEYGLPSETSTSFRVVNENGKASPLPATDAQQQGTSGEIALDVEDARGLCHQCKILLVEADQPSNTDLDAAEDTAASLGATEISNSWGGPEYDDVQSGTPTEVNQNDVNAFNHPGVVITASTGDNGWDSWDFANNSGCGSTLYGCVSQNAPLWPSSSPDVVAVAGTALFMKNGARQEEDVWNENGPDDDNAIYPGLGWIGGAYGASGGGCSYLFAAPAWQSSMSGYNATGCAGALNGSNARMAGDIAAEADPYTGVSVYDPGSGGWFVVGGTSLASPLVAAMWALAGGSHGVSYPGKLLYQEAAAHPSAAYDVTIGGNGWCAGDDSRNCSQILASETHSTANPSQPGNGNPNGLTNPDGYNSGLKDCSFPFDGSVALSGDPFATQCNAVAGYDGASGVGTPNGLGLFGKALAVSITGPSTGKVGKKLSYTGSASDPNPVGQISTYTWKWGDGKSSSGAAAHHTWAAKGSYAVTLTVKDTNGVVTKATKTVTIS